MKGRSRAFDESTADRIVQRVAAGEALAKLADDYYCHPKTIGRLARICGVTPVQRGLRRMERAERILAEYNRGDTNVAIAVRNGMASPANITYILHWMEANGREVRWHKKQAR